MTTTTIATHDLIALFTERLTAVGGHVRVVTDSDSAAESIRLIAGDTLGRTIWTSEDVAHRAPRLVARVEDLGFTTRVPAGPGEVRDQPLGLAIAEGLIAETGTSILSEPRVNDRSVTLMTETLVVICPTAALMPSLDDAAQVLRTISGDGVSYATFVTGPSRTADIERQLTVGVQGPGVFHVILIDDLT
jgi:L-lactate dehydrogenase complex protein LldG